MGLFSDGNDRNLDRRVNELEREVRELKVRLAELTRPQAVGQAQDASVGAGPYGSPAVVAGGYVASAEVHALIARGELIQAIKQVRVESGFGLKEAKDHVDRLTGR